MVTEVSKIIKIFRIKDVDKNVSKFWFKSCLSRQIKICPAIIFAVSRIISVKGRIKDLIDSIITIKGIKAGGVPVGTKWAIKYPVFLNNILKVKDIQTGKDK